MRERELRRLQLRIDESINFCPHCGRRLVRISVVGETVCGECGKPFLCIVRERGEDDEKNSA